MPQHAGRHFKVLRKLIKWKTKGEDVGLQTVSTTDELNVKVKFIKK